MIRILLADDHPIVRRGLRQVLADSSDFLVGGEAATPAEVLAKIEAERWDVVLLDINLRGGNGIELIGEIRRARPETRILILTVFAEEQYAIRAIRAGAAGYLTKESAPDKLVEAVRKVASGGRWVSPELAETLASLLAGESSGPPHERLSDREFTIFKLIATGRTVSQVADELGLSVKTVSTHRTRMLRKMRMKTNAELMHYAARHRLVDVGP